MKEKYKYVLVDFYEGGLDIVAATATKQDLKKAYNERWADTDGECDLRGYDISTRKKRKDFKIHFRHMKQYWGE